MVVKEVNMAKITYAMMEYHLTALKKMGFQVKLNLSSDGHRKEDARAAILRAHNRWARSLRYKLRIYREEKLKLSQANMAKLLGVKAHHISQLERGKTHILNHKAPNGRRWITHIDNVLGPHWHSWPDNEEL